MKKKAVKIKTSQTRMQWHTLCAALRALPLTTLRAIAEVSKGDGLTIFKAEAYTAAGMPPEMVAHFTQTFDAQDGIIPEVTGIYGLRVVEAIVSALELPKSDAMCRGFRAQHAFRAILIHCGWTEAQTATEAQ